MFWEETIVVSRAFSSKRVRVACHGLLAGCLLCFGAQARAQCPARGSGTAGAPGAGEAAQGEQLLPESGLLSDNTYANLYFGFELRLPIPLHGHRIMLPITLPGEHALLAIGFQENNRYGTLKITAGGHREEGDNRLTEEQVQQHEDDIARSRGGVPPQYLPDYTPPPVHLKRVDRHSGDVHATQYTTHLRNYAIRFTIQTNDKTFLKKARDAVSALQVFCADDAGHFYAPGGKAFAPDGTPTTGPTIPTAAVDEAIRARPAEHTIPAPGFSNGALQVPELEFSYALPSGWGVLSTPTDLIADDAKDELPRRLSYLWKSCARNWLRAAGGMNGTANLELRVLDQSCLALPFPASASDNVAAESLGEYLEMLGHFGKIKSNRMVQPGNRLFVVFAGTVATGPPGGNLEQRDVQVIAVTRYKKLIFAWTWSSPTVSDLARIGTSNVKFGDTPPIAIGPTMIISRTSSQP